MKRDYAIVKMPGSRWAGDGGLESAAGAPLVMTKQLDEQQAAEAARTPDVRVAPVMPTCLIAPALIEPEDADVTGRASWGVSAVGAGDSRYDGAGAVVAVLDTGVDSGHPTFRGVDVTHANFSQDDAGDRHGHGTHCAGTVLGRDVDGLRIGVATGVTRLLDGKVLDDKGRGTTANALSGIEWALKRGAQVISLSLGLDFPGYAKQLIGTGYDERAAISSALHDFLASTRLFEAVAQVSALRYGALLVAAAGNESQLPDVAVHVAPPAAAAGVMSVAAVGYNGQHYTRASFSNVGADLAAPGVRIRSAAIGGGLTTMSGTSMATPHVAGVAALWLQWLREQRQTVTSERLGAQLIAMSTCAKVADYVHPTYIGAGVVQAP